MKRRNVLEASSCLAACVSLGWPLHAKSVNRDRRRVAVIGHTGRGNYGHGLDTVWLQVPETEIVAVADADAAGLATAKERLGTDQGYSDYRQMLAQVRPELVAIAPRHADQHHDMALAALAAGAKGLYIEKPFCRTPAEADSLIAAAEKHQAKIAVAHRNRYHPVLAKIDNLIEDGQLGKLLEIRGRGKGDHRGGDEDLWVLGSHIMNLIHYFAGQAKSCSAIMLRNGRPITAADVKPGAEGLGPLAADEVHARFETEKGIMAYYDSIANDGTRGEAYCMQLLGSQGMVTLFIDHDPLAYFVPGNPYRNTSQSDWQPITTAGVGQPEDQPATVVEVHNHVLAVRDLIEACDSDRHPLCDVHAGAMSIEMICAVFESHRQNGKTIAFPLTERGNALLSL